jgi:DNA-directed RNA polymerase subunit L
MLLQKMVRMTDEVTVSSMPHPISMFFLGIFAVAIIFMWIEISRSTKRKDKICSDMDSLQKEHNEFKSEMTMKFNELSKKIDSRVDKAIVGLKKQGKIND